MNDLDYRPDFPASQPQFDFVTIAEGLAPLLRADCEHGATVLGIHGPWGSGKTTLMNAIQREMKKIPGSISIEFNAWKFQDREALWRALILHVLGELREVRLDAWLKKNPGKMPEEFQDPKLREMEDKLYRAFSVDDKGPWKVQWKTLIVEILSIGLSLFRLGFVGSALKESAGFFGRLFGGDTDKDGKKKDENVLSESRIKELSGVLEREVVHRQINQVQSIEQFLDTFREMINEISGKGRILIYIDDLDRCLPESALEIFEAIKLFMDAPGVTYVIALDRDTIRKALAVRYTRRGEAAGDQFFLDPDEYIEKTISVSFDLPKLSQEDALDFITGIQLPLDLTAQERKTIVTALGTNPRRLRRFMNTLAVNLHIASAAGRVEGLKKNDKERALFLKLLLISYRFSGIFGLAREDERLLVGLQEISNTFETDKPDIEKAREARKQALDSDWSAASRLTAREDFWNVMALRPQLNDDPAALSRMMQWFRFRS
jgi:hypothetical protein